MSTLSWHLGTMGYSYKDWEGVFYPEGMKSRDYLAHYSQFFNAVEIDSTFYGTPRQSTVERWASVVPQDFCFSPKVPQQITHDNRLAGAAFDLMAEFLDTVRLFGDKLGPVLIQLPPDFKRPEISALAAFLDTLPDDIRFAVEFRHRSWHATETGELLQVHRICWASTEYQYLPQRVYVTTDFLYIRWIGRHGAYQQHDREREDKTERLREWLADIHNRQEEGVEAVFGFFNNDYAGFGPGTAQKFKELAGLPVQPLAPPQQGKLL